MGADLYITLVHSKNVKKYEPAFDEWVRKRGEAVDEEAEKVCQEKVTYYYNKMNDESGYYRDSYNSSNLVNLFGLSYWQDFDQWTTKGEMSPAQAQELLDELKKREPIFKKNLDERVVEVLAKDTTETEKQLRDYFIGKYFQLQRFLKRAIELNSNIDCSL
jgi:polyhydroxyalkanoate synthesis regulator phasin